VSRRLLTDLLPTGQPVAWLRAPRGKLCAVPMDSWRLSFGGMALYPGYRTSARLAQMLLRAWVTSRAVASSSARRDAAVRSWPLGALLRTSLPTAVGASGVVTQRGATLLIMDGAGAALAYVKYSESAEGIRLLRAQASLLGHVPDGLGPRVLLHAPFRSGEILVQTVIGGRPCAPRLALGRPQQAFLRALACHGDGVEFPASEHPLVMRHRKADGLHSRVLERALDALRGSTWRLVLMHGDFTFANTRELDGACAAFDWEWGNETGFPHLDAAHWLIRVARGIQRLPPRAAAGRVVQVLSDAIDGPDRPYAAGLAALAAIHSAASWYGPDLGASDEAAWLLRFADACLDRAPPPRS